MTGKIVKLKVYGKRKWIKFGVNGRDRWTVDGEELHSDPFGVVLDWVVFRQTIHLFVETATQVLAYVGALDETYPEEEALDYEAHKSLYRLCDWVTDHYWFPAR